MGGYSEQCPYCDKWFTLPQAIKDHIKGKHLNEYKQWLINKGLIKVKENEAPS